MSSWLEFLTIDGVTIPAWRKLAGLGSPPPRQDVRDRARRHGSIDRTRYYQPRLIEVTDAVLKGDPANIWPALDELKGAFALGSDHVVRFRRIGMDVDEFVTCRVAAELKADVDYTTPGLVLWSVALLCADPRIYVDELTTARYSPSTALGGVDFPLTFPLVFSSNPASVLEVTPGGNFPTPPTFTVLGPAAAFSIVNETTAEAIVFTSGTTLAEGDKLTVDVAAREVILNGTSRVDLIDASQTTWFELGGTSALRLHGSGFAAGVTTLDVSYRSARI